MIDSALVDFCIAAIFLISHSIGCTTISNTPEAADWGDGNCCTNSWPPLTRAHPPHTVQSIRDEFRDTDDPRNANSVEYPIRDCCVQLFVPKYALVAKS